MEEKHGGLPYNMRKSMDFIVVIEAFVLLDIGFRGPYSLGPTRGVSIT